jgi:hypothetical protein
MLMYHPYASADGIRGRLESYASSIEQNVAGIRLKESEGEAHQRRLSSAVLAQESVYSSGPHSE